MSYFYSLKRRNNTSKRRDALNSMVGCGQGIISGLMLECEPDIDERYGGCKQGESLDRFMAQMGKSGNHGGKQLREGKTVAQKTKDLFCSLDKR